MPLHSSTPAELTTTALGTLVSIEALKTTRTER
jgi:hypothetical protein